MYHARGWMLACATLWCCAVSSAYGEINFVNLASGPGDRIVLQRIGVQRGGEAFEYDYAELITPILDDINVPSDGLRVVLLYADPLDDDRVHALSDPYVNTGIFDPGQGDGNFAPGAEFIKLTFAAPVRNEAGCDLLVFSIGFDIFSGPRPFYISFDGATSYLVDTAPDLALGGIEIIPYYLFGGGITAPSELLTKTPMPAGLLGNPPTVIPVPIIHVLDLSDFGVVDGGSIDTLYLHDASGTTSFYGPTMVVGLPAVSAPNCTVMDADGDGDVDLVDYANFQNCLTGP